MNSVQMTQTTTTIATTTTHTTDQYNYKKYDMFFKIMSVRKEETINIIFTT